jgi:sugar phosphate isomerase/epimerase
MSGIYVSTGAYRGLSLSEMVDACEMMEAGLELSSGVVRHANMDDEIEMVLTRRLPLLLHNYFPPPAKPFVLNLAARDPETLGRSIEMAFKAIDLSAMCGAAFYSVHSGFAMDLKAEDLGKPEEQSKMARAPYGEAYGIFSQAVREVASYGQARGVRLLIENNVMTREQVEGERPLLMTEPGEIAKFLREMDDLNVGLLLDVGHAKVTAGALGIEPERYFEELTGWIGAVHLSDNDGTRDNNRAFGPEAWFAKYFLGDLPLIIEVYGIGVGGAGELVEIVKGWVGEKAG